VRGIVLTDFDGTMVTIDTAEYVLNKFANKDWRLLDEQLVRGEITFQESLVKEFAMLRVSEKAMIDALDAATQFRPHFDKMIEYCEKQGFPLVVVSGGLDFSIRHFLEKNGWLNLVEIYAPKAQCTENGVVLQFPKLLDPHSSDFKEDLVKYYRKEGRKVVYIGNGLGDYSSAKKADLSLAIEGSQLARLCKDAGATCQEITDFQQAVDLIRIWVSHNEKKP
jgi:2,3-diketo-5-methylthio-1-phosphopentane phosphatase